MENHIQSQGQTQNVPKKAWYKKWWVIALGIFIIFVVMLSGSENEGEEALSPTPSPEAKVVYDIPSLLNKDIDQVKESLGAPRVDTEPTKEQLAGGIATWEKSYTKDNQDLMITYSLKDRSVQDFFLSGEDKEHLLKVGGLKENEPSYSLEFVKQLKDPTKITGVIITPKK